MFHFLSLYAVYSVSLFLFLFLRFFFFLYIFLFAKSLFTNYQYPHLTQWCNGRMLTWYAGNSGFNSKPGNTEDFNRGNYAVKVELLFLLTAFLYWKHSHIYCFCVFSVCSHGPRAKYSKIHTCTVHSKGYFAIVNWQPLFGLKVVTGEY